jgi:CDP-glucose 4,6-dehydratase
MGSCTLFEIERGGFLTDAGKLDFESALSGRRVLVTGHTGFTGSWACLWLSQLGADVVGFSLAPDTTPSLYIEGGVANDVAGIEGDVCDLKAVHACFARFQPELVLHLAAQPLVRRSYREPVSTFATNAMGTAHVLEAARTTIRCRSVVCVTTDKVYKNNEWAWPYRENDALGGKDPYSASKAAAEMVIDLARGFASIHILVLFGIGFQSLLLGILGEYLMRIYLILRAEPVAIAEDTLNLAPADLKL